MTMGKSIEHNSELNSLREHLLVKKTILDEDLDLDATSATEASDDLSGYSDEVEATHDEHAGSSRTSYVIGQWIWLYLVWSNIRDLVDGCNMLPSPIVVIMAWSLVMAGHFFFLTKLSISGRTARVNQETLPVIVSGLRMFCLGSGDTTEKFLVIIGMSFLLFELYSALVMTLVQKKDIFDEMAVEYDEEKDDDDAMDNQYLEYLEENSIVESQADAFGNENKDELASRIGNQTEQYDWGVSGHWIWLLSVWFIVPYFIEHKATNLLRDDEDAYFLTWLVAMFGHGSFLLVRNDKSDESLSLFCVNAENLPMMMSTFYLCSHHGTADLFLRIVAIWFLLSQTLQAVRHFMLDLVFTKVQEPEETAKLEA